jgi:hypothetical protein
MARNYTVRQRPNGLVFSLVDLVKTIWRMHETVGRRQDLVLSCKKKNDWDIAKVWLSSEFECGDNEPWDIL